MDFSRFNPADPFGLVAKRVRGTVDKPHIYLHRGFWWCVSEKGTVMARFGRGKTPLEAYELFRELML